MTRTNDPNARPANDWSPCAPGTLGGLSERLRVKQTRRTQSRVAGGVLAAAVVLLAFSFWPTATSALPGGITCRECVALAPAYHQLLVDGVALAPGKSEAVTRHLGVCQRCRRHYETLYPGDLAAAVAGLGLLSITTPSSLRRRRG